MVGPDEKIFLARGMIFGDVYQFRRVLKDFFIQEGVTIRKLKNEKSRVTCECADPTCKWRLHASPMVDNVTYRIKTYNGDHTCQ